MSARRTSPHQPPRTLTHGSGFSMGERAPMMAPSASHCLPIVIREFRAAPGPHEPTVKTELAGFRLPRLQLCCCVHHIRKDMSVRAELTQDEGFPAVAEDIEVLRVLLHVQLISRISMQVHEIQDRVVQDAMQIDQSRVTGEGRVRLLLDENSIVTSAVGSRALMAGLTCPM